MDKVDMVLSKEEMYKMIWLDYFDCPKSERTQSFIYSYLKKSKTRRCKTLSSDMQALTDYGNQKRFDKFTMLKSTRLAYKNQVSDRDFFVSILADLTGTDISEFAGKADAELFELSVNKEEKLLFGCITDFFQNSGYRFKKKESGERLRKGKDETEKKLKDGEYEKVDVKYTRKQDGYISDLDMWADFYLYNRNKGQTVSGTLDGITVNDEYIEKCEKLYTELLNEEQTDVFVPLCFDVRSGAGIYIIGSDLGSVPDDKPCCIFVSCFFYVDSCDYANEELLLSMQFTPVKSIQEAFDLFRKGGAEFFQHYTYQNNSFPTQADKCFNVFFGDTASSRLQTLVQNQLERENNDIANNKTIKYSKAHF